MTRFGRQPARLQVARGQAISDACQRYTVALTLFELTYTAVSQAVEMQRVELRRALERDENETCKIPDEGVVVSKRKFCTLTLQRHLYEHAFYYKGLQTYKKPLSLVACARKPAIL
jgi:hypothetical protein